jgi:hypothetical protein
MLVLLKDVGFVLGLWLDGPAVTGIVDPTNWKGMVEQFMGYRPPNAEVGMKEKKTYGVSSAWLRARFNNCPPHALVDVVERYAKVWLWHMVAQFLFLDASGNTMLWMVLP